MSVRDRCRGLALVCRSASGRLLSGYVGSGLPRRRDRQPHTFGKWGHAPLCEVGTRTTFITASPPAPPPPRALGGPSGAAHRGWRKGAPCGGFQSLDPRSPPGAGPWRTLDAALTGPLPSHRDRRPWPSHSGDPGVAPASAPDRDAPRHRNAGLIGRGEPGGCGGIGVAVIVLPVVSMFPASAFVCSATAFRQLCRLYDPLLVGDAPDLSRAARTDLRAFARLYDLPEAMDEAQAWSLVRRRLAADLPVRADASWALEGLAEAA